MSTTKNDRYAKELAAAWNLSLNAARDIRDKQIASGAPSVNDLMPSLLRHYDHALRDFGSLCLGVRPLPSRIAFDRWTVPASDSSSGVSALVATMLFEGGPVFAATGGVVTGVGISGGANSGKTTMLHALIEQAASVTSPHDTALVLIAEAGAPICSRVSHLSERVQILAHDNPDGVGWLRVKNLLVFIDDADRILPGNENSWRFAERSITGAGTRVFYTAATAAPRVLPRRMLTDSQHVNLRGGTLPNAAVPQDDWMFCTSGVREAGLCMSDLPAGTSPIDSGRPYRLTERHHKGLNPRADPATRAGLFEGCQLIPQHAQLDVSGISEAGYELEGYGIWGAITCDMSSPPSPNEQAIQRLRADIAEAVSQPGFTSFYSGGDPKGIIEEVKQKRFPRPIIRRAPGLFMSENPEIWAYNGEYE